MSSVTVATRRDSELISFLRLNEYEVEEINDNILRVSHLEELPVYISVNERNMYFELDLGNVSALAKKDLYFKLLDMNTEILPVSFAINNTNPEDPRLVLVESRETGDLSDQELLAVFDALYLAVDKAEALLAKYMK